MIRPMGRQTIYTDDMPDKLAEAMFNGVSIERFCRNVRICKQSLYNWIKIYPELMDAFLLGKNDCEAYWEDWLVKNLDNKNVNYGLTKMFFTNRFGWKDKTEQETTVRLDETTQKAKDNLAEYEKSY